MRPRTASTVIPKTSEASATVSRLRPVCDWSSTTRGILAHQDRLRKPSEAIFGARWTDLTPVQASVHGLCRRRVQREETFRQRPGLLFGHRLEGTLGQLLPTLL